MHSDKPPPQREAKLAALRTALEEGERSPVAKSFSLERVLKKLQDIPR